MLKCCLNN